MEWQPITGVTLESCYRQKNNGNIYNMNAPITADLYCSLTEDTTDIYLFSLPLFKNNTLLQYGDGSIIYTLLEENKYQQIWNTDILL